MTAPGGRMDMTETTGSVGSLVRRVLLIAFLLALASSAAALVFNRTDCAVSLAAGATAAMVSFIVLVLTVTRALAGGRKAGRAGAVVLAAGFLKLALLGAALWWLVSRKMIEPITFLAGFSTVVLALIVEGIRIKRKA